MPNGLKFITTATFTASSSVSIDNCFSATYTHYLVKRKLLGSGTENGLGIRLRVTSTDASGADYRYQYVQAAATSVSAGRTTGATSWIAALGYTETTAIGYSETWIANPFEAVRTTAWQDAAYDNDASVTIQSVVYEHDLTASYTGLTVIPAAGTITGTISVFGVVRT